MVDDWACRTTLDILVDDFVISVSSWLRGKGELCAMSAVPTSQSAKQNGARWEAFCPNFFSCTVGLI